MDQYIAEIRMFGCNFPPRNWAFCNGQQLSIASNSALFSLLGTTYGGNGTTVFNLPDLRGNASVHFGQAPGLSVYVQGETLGVPTVTLAQTELPGHSHPLACFNDGGANPGPKDAVLCSSGADSRSNLMYSDGNTGTTAAMNPQAVKPTGNNGPHNNMSPYLPINVCIALTGIYPPRT